MAVVYLNAGATDLSQNASWSGGSVPTTSDEVRITQGNQTVDTGVATLSGVGLGKVMVAETFKGQLGTAASGAVSLGDPSSLVLASGGGRHLIDAGTCADVRVRRTNGGQIILADGAITTLYAVDQADLVIGAAPTVTNLYNMGAAVSAAYNSTGFTLVRNILGTLLTKRAMTTEDLINGLVTVVEGATAGTINLWGGRHVHNGGNITTLNGFAGLFDTAGSQDDFTISTHNRFRQHVARLVAGAATVTVSTPNDFEYQAA